MNNSPSSNDFTYSVREHKDLLSILFLLFLNYWAAILRRHPMIPRETISSSVRSSTRLLFAIYPFLLNICVVLKLEQQILSKAILPTCSIVARLPTIWRNVSLLQRRKRFSIPSFQWGRIAKLSSKCSSLLCLRCSNTGAFPRSAEPRSRLPFWTSMMDPIFKPDTVLIPGKLAVTAFHNNFKYFFFFSIYFSL